MTDVRSFEIEGLNGRKKSIFYDLDRHVNVFFGPNGSGKTSILKILNSAMRNQPQLVSNVEFHKASVRIHSISYDKDFVMSYAKPADGETRIHDAPVQELSETTVVERMRGMRLGTSSSEIWKTTPKPGGERSSVQRWKHTYLPTNRLYVETPARTEVNPWQFATDSVLAEDTLDASFARSLQNLWSNRYGEILGRVRSIQQEALQSIFLDVLSGDASITGLMKKSHQTHVLEADRAFARMSSFLKRQSDQRVQEALGSSDDFIKRYNVDVKLRQIVSRIDAVEARIELEMRPIQEMSDLVKRLFLEGKSVSFDGPRIAVATESRSNIGLERLSSGEKHLLRILVAALDAGESSLLIDEPELSMHIDWQRELVRNIHLLNPDCQSILATHSPEIMADIADESIFRV